MRSSVLDAEVLWHRLYYPRLILSLSSKQSNIAEYSQKRTVFEISSGTFSNANAPDKNAPDACGASLHAKLLKR
jgi:hypothetical protein